MNHPRRTLLGIASTTLSLGLVAGTAPPATALPDWGSGRTTWTNPRAHQPQVVDVRWGEHKRFDRVVIDLKGRRPGYDVEYVKKLTMMGSGDKVQLRGKRRIEIRLFPARAHDRRGESVYAGPRKRKLDLDTLRGIAFLGDFEGQVNLGLTTSSRAPYRAFTLPKPNRIVIDLKH